MSREQIQIRLANPRGFCAGVDRAIEIVERALDKYGSPIYVRHEVVHNKFVVDNLHAKGVVFIDDLDEVPKGATVIFSAHGVSESIRNEAKQRGLNVYDATCPLVTKVHIEVKKYCQQGLDVLLIGHAGHPEVEGTMGQVKESIYLVENLQDVENLQVANPDKLAYVSQTTLSVDDTAKIVDALCLRFPNIVGPLKDDICYATQNRQDAVKKLAKHCDIIFVVGSLNSSNSNRLQEISQLRGVQSFLVDDPDQIQDEWLQGEKSIGVTAGASAPESLVKQVVDRLNRKNYPVTELTGPDENISFSLPVELR